MERYHIRPDASVYFLTHSVVEWLPAFVSEASCRIITDSLDYCHEHNGLRTNGFVIMPTKKSISWIQRSSDGGGPRL